MKVTYESVEDPSDPDGSRNLAAFFDLLWGFAKKDAAKKRRLKNEPDGFPVDGGYSCLVCRNGINETTGWYDWYGQTCLLCRRAIKDGTIPAFICHAYDSYQQHIHNSAKHFLLRKLRIPKRRRAMVYWQAHSDYY